MILVFSGGVDSSSLNTKLAKIGEKYLEGRHVKSEMIVLSQYDIPLLMPGKQEKPCEAVKEIREKIQRASGIFITTPEYNGNIPPALLNMLDSVFNFVFFPTNTLEPLQNKPVLVGGASPSMYGSVKACQTLNRMLLHMGAIVCPHSVSVPQAHKALDEEDGKIIDKTNQDRLENGLEMLINLASVTGGERN